MSVMELRTMKEACEEVGMPYETLKFYCKEGLVPNVKRDRNNYRAFDERNIGWLKGLQCLRKCGMGVKDMKQYMDYCMEGVSSIPQRKTMLEQTRAKLTAQMEELLFCIEYIDGKQAFYDRVLSGEMPYTSNLLDIEPQE